MSGIFRAVGLSPSITAIDANLINRFSWVSQSGLQTNYRVYIYNNSTNALVYDSYLRDSSVQYHDVPASSLTNGIDYKWYVVTASFIGTEDSEYEFFTTAETPVVTFSYPSFTSQYTERIESFDTLGQWTPSSNGTISLSTIIYDERYGNQSIQFDDDGTTGFFYMTKTGVFNLHSFSNGSSSNTSDFIRLVAQPYFSDEQTFVLELGNGSDYFYKEITPGSLTVFEVLKSTFTEYGSPSWENITFIKVGYNCSAGYSLGAWFMAIELFRSGDGTDTTFNKQDNTFYLNYAQTESVGIKKYKFKLYDEDSVLITDTGWIYDMLLKYTFEGLSNGVMYKIEGLITSQYDQEGITGLKTFIIDYSNDIILPAIATTISNSTGSILIDWSNINFSSADFSGTASYVAGKFNYGLNMLDTEYVTFDLTLPLTFTLTFWNRIITNKDGVILQLGASTTFGFDSSLNKFYYNNNGSYTYSDEVTLYSFSDVYSDTWGDYSTKTFQNMLDSSTILLTDYFFIGITSTDLIVKKANELVCHLSLPANTTPYENIKIYGEGILDNVHCQSDELTYSELLEEDTRNIITCNITSPATFESNSTKNYNFIQLSTTRFLLEYYMIGTSRHVIVLTDENLTTLAVYTCPATYIENKAAITKISSTKVILLYSKAGSGVAIMANVTGDSFSISSETIFSLYEVDSLSLDYLDGNSVLAGYNEVGVTTPYLQVLNYATSTVTENRSTASSFNSTSLTNKIKVKVLSTIKAIVYYFDATSKELRTRIVNISDINITLEKYYILDNRDCIYFDVCLIDSTHLAYSFTPADLSYLKYGITTISGTLVNNSYYKTTIVNNQYSQICLISSSLLAISYYDTNMVKYRLVTLNANYDLIEEDLISSGNYLETNMFLFNSKLLLLNKGGSNYLIYRFLETFTTSATTYDKQATWISNSTLALADFESNLSIGNQGVNTTGFRLKRKASDGLFYITLSDFANTVNSYTDTTARNAITYTYLLNSLDVNSNEDLGVEVTGILDFYGWFLTDGTTIYKFDAATKSESIKTNRAFNVFETYSQYPTVSYGNRNYRTSSLTTIPYSFNTDFEFTYTTLEALRAFIDSETTKYLKNTKGEIIQVATTNFSYKYLDEVIEQPYEITFDWTEIGVGEAGLV